MVPILILDGGLGTSLEQKYDIKFDSSTPLWSSSLLVSDPDRLLACQTDFGNVPVDILLTATYQVSVHGFEKTNSSAFTHGIPKQNIPSFLDKAVTIAEQAKCPDAKVALSIGPYGACMTPSQEYSGLYDPEHNSGKDLQEWHAARLRLFAQVPNLVQRVSYLAFETIPRLDEVAAMRRALDSEASLSDVPFWMSSLFPGDDEALPDGTSVEDVVSTMLHPDVALSVPWGVGINCTKIWKLDSLVRQYERAIAALLKDGFIKEWPALVLYPDGTNGEVYNTTTQTWDVPEDGERVGRSPWETQLAEVVKGTQTRGSWRQIVVGGCCMSSAEDIKRLRQALPI